MKKLLCTIFIILTALSIPHQSFALEQSGIEKATTVQNENPQDKHEPPHGERKDNNTSRFSLHHVPNWVWFAIAGCLAFAYFVYRYRKYCKNKFDYDMFSLSILLCLSLLFAGIIVLYILNTKSVSGEFWGIPTHQFKIILILTFILTVIGLYIYNFKQTNWYLALINVFIQAIAVIVFVLIVVVRLLLKIIAITTRSSKAANSNDSHDKTQ
jgi:drug/metabolite transporter (DMT)-like permease